MFSLLFNILSHSLLTPDPTNDFTLYYHTYLILTCHCTEMHSPTDHAYAPSPLLYFSHHILQFINTATTSPAQTSPEATNDPI